MTQMSLIPPPAFAALTLSEIEELVSKGALTRRNCKLCSALIFVLKDADGGLQPLEASAPVYRITIDASGEPFAMRTTAFVSHYKHCPSTNVPHMD